MGVNLGPRKRKDGTLEHYLGDNLELRELPRFRCGCKVEFTSGGKLWLRVRPDCRKSHRIQLQIDFR